MHTRFMLQVIVGALRRRRVPAARDAERALHAATDHADLKRLVEVQARRSAAAWWPGAR